MNKRSQVYLAVAAGLTLAGCTTPVIMLRNGATGQIARCGGSSSGFMAGGLIGRSIQEGDDQQCARDFEALGFTRIR